MMTIEGRAGLLFGKWLRLGSMSTASRRRWCRTEGGWKTIIRTIRVRIIWNLWRRLTVLRNDVSYIAISPRALYNILPFMHVLVPDSRIAKVLMDHVTTSKINLCTPISSRMAYLSLKYTVTHQFHRGIVRFKPEQIGRASCRERVF